MKEEDNENDYDEVAIFKREHLLGMGFALAIPDGDDFRYIGSTRRTYKFKSGEIVYWIPKRLFKI